MAIDLTALRIASAAPALMEFGGLLTPPLGGPVQKIVRPGDRWAWRFETRPYRMDQEGAALSALMVQAKKDGALVRVSQPGIAVGNPSAPVVATATSSGRAVPLYGVTPGYALGAGRWVSIIIEGRRYLDQVRANAVAAGDGTMMLPLANLLRRPAPAGAVVEIAVPKIEGWIADAMEWPLPANRVTSFAFTVMEAE